jgi:NAD(P)-dependent dehydrogenase (short-subunit alcohol dehydrogenase family)
MSADGKIVLVTGAGSGIGRASAQALAKAGFRLALAGRRLDALEETASLAGVDDCLCVSTDVSDTASVDALFKSVEDRFGRLDVLFNNAGTNAPGKTIDELTPEQWKTVIDVNLTGSFLCARGAFALMRRQSPQGGRIINNGSISAYVPRPGSAPYTASKHAISGLTKTISLDGRPFDIACGQVDVGNAATELAARMATGVPQANGEIAVEPLMDVSHVGDAVAHMASLPLSANIMFLNVMATKMPFAGRG